ncbi:MAG: Imidazole glycerol phosphate synthase subunit HisH [Candidatus Argoarchaeum ethanivorans]|uniref:Imidazole glycerol phosphate synthase subunit HisH n=1 Tax=Candidatus Argoarchaeum ethanivorans TaxID=2608793 RepID=A0A811TG96_9EURY|nr:MAG: Imidazole glycerol phosphate synthase subunit HisH [Candidatus Argoarchaeum ethanivorans]
MKTIVIIDYGLGNLRSVQKAFEHAGAKVSISNNVRDIRDADGLVLPGVGAFYDGMAQLQEIKYAIYDVVNDDKPLLGICLGMQMLLTESEEGGRNKGLDIIQGQAIRFPKSKFKVPHIGWNSLDFKDGNSFLRNIDNNSYVYFVHSYYAKTSPEYTVATCTYGLEFAAIIKNKKGNVIGTQYHPEKSGDVGLQMIQNFLLRC